MAKKQAAKVTDAFDAIKPYLERALRDEDFRNDLKDALGAARELYGPISKENGVSGTAKAIATDKKAQEQIRRAVEDLLSAKDHLQGKKRSGKKGRRMLLLAGIVAGALYNPWTGPQTREKLLDLIAGDDDLQPLETFDAPPADVVAAADEAAAAEETSTATKSKASKASSEAN